MIAVLAAAAGVGAALFVAWARRHGHQKWAAGGVLAGIVTMVLLAVAPRGHSLLPASQFMVAFVVVYVLSRVTSSKGDRRNAPTPS
jgi:hypothetical protein